MNHYPHHIGDFNNATRHLTRVERALYRDLIDVYYDTEQALPADDFDTLARRILARTDEEKDALKVVLKEFFTLENGAYHNPRCDKEILKYQGLRESASKAGKASVQARLNGRSTVGKQPLAKRLTNQNQNQNHIPPTPKGSPFDDFWAAYPRKTGKDAARKAFDKRGVTGELLAEMLTALAAQTASEQWHKDGGQYIPHPSTWLNEGRWQDEEMPQTTNIRKLVL